MKDSPYCTLQWYKAIIWARTLSHPVNYWDFGHRSNSAFNFLYEITRLLVILLNMENMLEFGNLPSVTKKQKRLSTIVSIIVSISVSVMSGRLMAKTAWKKK